MSFSCSCDTSGWDFFDCRRIVARKPHVCCECLKTISPGEEYEYAAGKFDGDMVAYHLCEECADLSASYGALGFCWESGELWFSHCEELREAHTPDDHPAMIKAEMRLREIDQRRLKRAGASQQRTKGGE